MSKNFGKLLPPKNDVVFQELFTRGKEDITKAMLEDILKIKITNIELDKNKELLNDNTKEKNGRLDVRAILNNSIECDIEVQLAVHKKAIERFLYYWAKIYSSNLDIGEKYSKLRKTISIIILGENLDNLSYVKAHTKWRIREDETKNVILTNDLELHIIELPKAIEEYKNNKKDEVLQWSVFLENPEKEEVTKIMEENSNIKEAKEELEKISSDEEIRRRALNLKMAKMDEAQFLEDAISDEREEIIKNMIKERIDNETIKKVMKITDEEIYKIKNNIQL